MTNMLYYSLKLTLLAHINDHITNIGSLLAQICPFNGYVKLPVVYELTLLNYMHKKFKLGV